jgi:adenine-specific DNA-methyltransferase
MIYIDPPYNTGNDFIYPDDYAESLKTYLEYTGQIDEEGRRFSTNTDTDGRFHSKWLNMMYPRLYLARNLLRDDGVIFISIDDHEVENLRRLCDDIFGEENHVATAVWQSKDTPGNDSKNVAATHNYIASYRRSPDFRPALLPRTTEQIAHYKNPDGDVRGDWLPVPLTRSEFREHDWYPLTNLAGQEVWPPAGTSWRRPRGELDRLAADNRIWWGRRGDASFPFEKRFLGEVKPGVVATTWWPYVVAVRGGR